MEYRYQNHLDFYLKVFSLLLQHQHPPVCIPSNRSSLRLPAKFKFLSVEVRFHRSPLYRENPPWLRLLSAEAWRVCRKKYNEYLVVLQKLFSWYNHYFFKVLANDLIEPRLFFKNIKWPLASFCIPSNILFTDNLRQSLQKRECVFIKHRKGKPFFTQIF